MSGPARFPAPRWSLISSVITVLLCSLAPGTSSLRAQDLGAITEGSRVRITAPELRFEGAVGTVQELTANDMIVYVSPRGIIKIPLAQVTWLDVSTERRPRGGQFGFIGLFAGGAIGAAVGFASGDDPPCQTSSTGHPLGDLGLAMGCALRNPQTAQQKAVTNGVAFGILGGLAGIFVGRVSQQDTWASVELREDRISVRPAVGADGLRLSFRIGT